MYAESQWNAWNQWERWKIARRLRKENHLWKSGVLHNIERLKAAKELATMDPRKAKMQNLDNYLHSHFHIIYRRFRLYHGLAKHQRKKHHPSRLRYPPKLYRQPQIQNWWQLSANPMVPGSTCRQKCGSWSIRRLSKVPGIIRGNCTCKPQI